MRDRRLADLGGGVRVVDLAIALVTTASAVLVWAWPSPLGPIAVADVPEPSWRWALPVLLAETLPVAWRRAAPLPALAVSAAAGVVSTLTAVVAPELGAYHLLLMVALQVRRRVALAAMAALLATRVAMYTLIDDFSVLLVDVSICSVAFTFGRWLQSREVEVARLRERDRLLGIDAEDRARAILADERARLARELHDGIAQSMVIIAAQSSTAARTLRDDPADAEQALAEMQAVGREGIVELRRLLGVLRDDGGDPAAPSDRLSRLDALVARYRAAGLPVQLRVTGDVRPLPAPVDLSGYRLVQEALTNALKHAGPARAAVLLDYGPDALRVEVIDDGRGGPFVEGHGLHGMRERALLLGGTLDAGPRPEGGFAVRARLPLPS
jgi:signal transduction histidine kinase